MSHEIRTPMNGMLVMAELLATSNLESKHQRYADVIMKSGTSLLSIINDVLDFSKIESGNLELEQIPVNLRVLAEDAMTLFWQQASQKGLDIACLIEPDVPDNIAADPVRLNQIICNLINNALKFTERGNVRLHVSMVTIEDSREAVKIAVVDTGIGIHRDKLDKVFESFTQADQSTTRRYGGTGLGLPICKKLVEAMGGEIAVESEPGYGATFSCTLPVTPSQRRKGLALPLPSGAGKTALLVLPVSATFHVLHDALERLGVSVRTIFDPDSGADIPTSDYVLARTCDITGLFDDNQNSDFIALTSLGDGTADQLIAEGRVQDLLPMPVSSHTALEVLSRVINGKALGKIHLVNEQTKAKAHVSFEGRRILVVDDNPVNREVVVQALRRFDIYPTVVENGLEALSSIEHSAFDLVFMDCSMPEMDGFQATQIIRQREADRNAAERMPIIALTAHVADQISDQWQSAGMDDIIVKPFTMESLERCLQKYLGEPALEPMRGEAETSEQDESLAEVFDPAAIENLRDILGDAFEFSFRRLIGLYQDNAPQLMADLASAVEFSDMKTISETSHALKSMSGNVSASHLSILCAHLEKAADRQDDAAIKSGFKALHLSHMALLQAIGDVLRADDDEPLGLQARASG